MDSPRGHLDSFARKVLGEELRRYFSQELQTAPPDQLVNLLQKLRTSFEGRAGSTGRHAEDKNTYPFDAERCFDPETLTLLHSAFDEAQYLSAVLHPEPCTREELAQTLIALAAEGEKEPSRMAAKALITLITRRRG